MKGTYPISRILRRFFRIGFDDTFQQPEISPTGRCRSEQYYRDRQIAPPMGVNDPAALRPTNPYEKYQKERQAGKLISPPYQPPAPGRILKLPLDFPSSATEFDPTSIQKIGKFPGKETDNRINADSAAEQPTDKNATDTTAAEPTATAENKNNSTDRRSPENANRNSPLESPIRSVRITHQKPGAGTNGTD